MGYYVRILGKKDEKICLAELNSALKEAKVRANLILEKGTSDTWEQLVVAHNKKNEICVIEKNPINKTSLGETEIKEFLQEIAEDKPKSAVKWLNKYLPTVKVIYAFQILDGAYKKNGWEIIDKVRFAIWNKTGGIIQADNEGFSNENGYHILWQFSNNVSGDWNMAVLNSLGKWVPFTMDLGNKKQRNEFFDGKVPKGAKLIKF